jgi:hypothetical protein
MVIASDVADNGLLLLNTPGLDQAVKIERAQSGLAELFDLGSYCHAPREMAALVDRLDASHKPFQAKIGRELNDLGAIRHRVGTPIRKIDLLSTPAG